MIYNLGPVAMVSECSEDTIEMVNLTTIGMLCDKVCAHHKPVSLHN